MYMIKRRFVFTVISTTILLSTSRGFVMAEEAENNCEACRTTSPYIDNYIKFGYEIIKTLLTYANTDQYALQQKKETNNTKWSSQTNMDPEHERILQSIVDNLNNQSQSIASTTYAFSLISIETAFTDSWKSMIVLLQNQSLLRDWQKVDALWQSIANTIIDMWNAGVFERLGFRQWRDERIYEIIDRYSKMNNAPIELAGSDIKNIRTQPKDLLWALWRMNQALKTTISVWNNIADNLDNKFLWKELQFSQKAQAEIPVYYSCARWVQWMSCSKKWQRAKEGLDAVRRDTKNQTKDAKTTFKNAIKRLQGFRSQNDQTKELLKQRQNELLRSEYGWQWVRNNEWKPLTQWLRDSRRNLKQQTTEVWPFAWLKVNPDKPAWEPFVVWDIATAHIQQREKETLSTAFNSVRQDAIQNRREWTYVDVSPITRLFPLISQEITTAQYRVDSIKPESIVNNLWKACDLQCRNVWWTCWYQ